MIKEKAKKKKKEKTFVHELVCYAKTAGISFLVAAVFTTLLSFHARSVMIKNLYASKENKIKLERKVAQQIVSHTDLTATLHDKSYPVALHVGDLYEAAGDLQKAEYAYHIATQKSPPEKFTAFQKLCIVLISQDKVDQAIDILDSVEDINRLGLIRFKTRVYIVLGDKYYSRGKFLKASEAYEKANYYYNRLTKKDKYIQKSIHKRLVKSYVEAAGVIVKNGYNSDAVRFLKKALQYDPKNLQIQYRLAIVYADLDPIIAVDYFEPLIAKIPQDIDYDAYNRVLMKAANIMDIQGNSTKAKYYRYKIHSLDVYTTNKVVYKEDIEVFLNSFSIKKMFFTYKLKTKFTLKNVSSKNIRYLQADFVLRKGDKEKEVHTISCASRKRPLYSNGGELANIEIKFGNNIFTKRELDQYYIDIYLYKVKKFKTLVATIRVPLKSIHSSNFLVSPHL